MLLLTVKMLKKIFGIEAIEKDFVRIGMAVFYCVRYVKEETRN